MGNNTCQLCNKQAQTPLNSQSTDKWTKPYHIYCYNQSVKQMKINMKN